MKILIWTLAVVSLTACGMRVSDPDLEVYCPQVREYSEDFNFKLANEIEALPEGSTLIPKVIADYAELRDLLRYCKEVRPQG
jgi:hypothetical protein